MTVSVISFKGCSKAAHWKWLGLVFKMVIRVNVTDLRPPRARKYVQADKGNWKSHQKYDSEYSSFPFLLLLLLSLAILLFLLTRSQRVICLFMACGGYLKSFN